MKRYLVLKVICRVILPAVFLAGCGGVHIYDAENHAVAKSVVTNNEAVDLTTIFSNIRDNLNTLQTAEKQVHRDVRAHIAKRQVFEILRVDDALPTTTPLHHWLSPTSLNDGNGTNDPTSFVATRLTQLGVQNSTLDEAMTKMKVAATAYSTLLSRLEPFETKGDDFLRIRVNMATFGWPTETAPIPSCANLMSNPRPASLPQGILADASPAAQNAMLSFLQSLYDTCKLTQTPELKELKEFDGEIGEAFNTWMTTLASLDEVAATEKSTKQSIKQLTKATAVKPSESSVAKLQEKAEDVGKLVGKANDALGKLGEDLAFSEERIDAINTVLIAFKTGSSDVSTTSAAGAENETLRQAVIVAAGLPAIGTDIETLQDILNRPEGRALLLAQLTQEQLRLDHLKARKALLETRATAARGRLEALLREVVLYRNGYDALTNHGGALANASLTQILDAPNGRDKIYATRGITSFVQAQTIARADATSFEMSLVDIQHREVVLLNEYAAKSWKALIDGPIGEIATYWEGGIKPETLADLAVGLGQIATFGFIGVKAVDD